MKSTRIVLGLLAACAALYAADITGTWLGSLEFPGGKLRIVFRITEQPDKTLAALMDSPDQGARDLAASKVEFRNDSLLLESDLVQGSFAGALSADGQHLNGIWSQGGMDLPLVLDRVDRAEVLERPQDPKKPYPYRELEVSYENKAAGAKLAGTLTLPKGRGRFPVVLLISGSGGQDRNEELFGHRPFLVLADYLTRRGIAVLRVDDRGIGKSTGSRAKATTRDYADDVKAGVAWLKTRPEIDRKRIGLLGHSEGGLIAPMVAVESPDVAFVVLIAGPGVTGEEILYLQGWLINKSEGTSDAVIAEQLAIQKSVYAVLKAEPDSARAADKLFQMAAGAESLKAALTGKHDSSWRLVADRQIKTMNSEWFRFFLTYDPKPALTALKIPVLALFGEKDLQVPPSQNRPEVEAALAAGSNPDYVVRELPGLNHMLQTAVTGGVGEYAQTDETMSPTALQIIGDWIAAHTAKKKQPFRIR